MLNNKAYVATFEEHLFENKYFGTRFKAILLPLCLIVMDYSAILAAVWSAYFVRNDIIPSIISLNFPSFDVVRVYIYVIIPCAYICFMAFDDLYTRRLLFWQQVGKIFKVNVYAMVSVLVLMYLTTEAKTMSRAFMILTWFFAPVYLVFAKLLVRKVLLASGLWQVPAVIIGSGKTAQLLVNAFERDSGLGYSVVGLIQDKPGAKRPDGCPVIGNLDQAEECVQRAGVKNVLITQQSLSRQQLQKLVYRLQPYVDSITLVPDLFGVPVGEMQLDTLFNEKAVLLKIRNNLANEYNCCVKRCIDIFGGLVGLIAGIPLLIVLALLIYADSPGPVIFAHQRIGKNGQVFRCYKLRTMITEAEKVLTRYLQDNPAARQMWEKDYKLRDDPRVTRIGRFLRKTSLDELPQLFNVLKGEMSLVGPRPIVAAEVNKYAEYIQDFYLVRPGITGLWQVSGRNDVDYTERVQLDSWYVRNWSMWLDVTLILRTIGIVARGRGAY